VRPGGFTPSAVAPRLGPKELCDQVAAAGMTGGTEQSYQLLDVTLALALVACDEQ
jgi:hypothetical protein